MEQGKQQAAIPLHAKVQQVATPPPAKAPQATPLPATGFIRGVILWGNPKADPPIPAILPTSRSTTLKKIKDGTYPLHPVKLSERCTAYRVEEVKALLAQLSGATAQ